MEIKMEISEKVAVVTGGLGGIGIRIIQSLLKNGAAYVAIFDLPKSDDEKVVQSLRELGKQFDKNKFGYFSCDVRNDQEFKACFDKVIEMRKNVDIFMNNAGVVNDVNIDLSIDVNYKAVVKGTFMALEHMRTDKGGRGGVIVNTASVAGLRNFPLVPVYCSTKHAVVAFVRTFKHQTKPLGVRVVCMCPCITDTPIVGNLLTTTFDFVDTENISKEIDQLPMQKPESVAEAMMEIIRKGDQGAVWVVEDDAYPDGVHEIDEFVQLRYKLK